MPTASSPHTIGNRHYALVAAAIDHGVQMIDITDPASPFDPLLLPYIELDLAGDRRATYADSDNTDGNLVFRYTVQEGDRTDDLAYKATDSLKLGLNTLADADDDTDLSSVTLPAPGAANSLSANKNISLNPDGTLRLVDGTLTDDDGLPCEGRLEILYNGRWGTICDDYWNVYNADVACRQLGFVGGAVDDWHRFRNSFFPSGASSQQIVLDDTRCEGYESNLMDCPSRQPTENNCQHFEDVGLRCIKNSVGPHITNIEISGPPGGNGTYDVDEEVTITLVWSEPVNVDLDVPPENPPPGCCHDGPPRVWLSYAEYVRTFNIANYHASPYASYTGGSGTDRLEFTNTISEFAGETSFSWVAVIHESLQLRSSRITSAATGKPVILGHGWYRSAETGMQAEAATIPSVPTFNDPGADRVYGAGETVEVTFTFSQPVRVDTAGGVPSVAVLLSGTDSRQAPYLRGSGTGQLVFAYTLTAGDREHASLLVEPNALTLNGGAIRDTVNDLDADIGHQGGGTLFVLQTDDAGPQLQSAAVDASSLTLTFDEELDNANPPSSGLFTVNVNGASRSVMAVGVGQSEVILLLATEVEAGDAVTVDYSLPSEETAARLQDLAGNAADSFIGQEVTNDTPPGEGTGEETGPLTGFTVVDASGGTQTVLATLTDGGSLTLDDPANGSYGIQVNTQSRAAIGSVRLQLTGGKSIDRTENIAPYSLYGDDGDNALHGEALPVGTYTLTATAYSGRALGGDQLGALSVSFTVQSPPNSPATGQPTIGGTAQVGETLTVGTSGVADADGLENAAFSYQWLADDAAIVGATGDSYTPVSADEGKTIKVRVTFTDDAGNEESVTSAATDAVEAAPVEEEATPLTASIHDAPASHDGSSSFTFELRFSETPKDNFSYKTLRDHAFTVTGGEVVKARRLERGSNIRWEIHVRPSGNGPVTIVLPVTTDCNASGAICTQDGRMLSEQLEVTVPGPDG